MRALGMIETMGLIPSIEALDAMLKAANVETLEKTNVRGGLVTVLVVGDVSAVKAAVDAGAAAAERVSQGALLSQHVIPRPDSQTDLLFKKNNKQSNHEIEVEEETEQPETAPDETAEKDVLEAEAAGEEEELKQTETASEETTNEVEASSEEEGTNEIEAEAAIEKDSSDETAIESKEVKALNSRAELEQFLEEQGIEKLMQVINNMRASELKGLAKEYEDGELQEDKNARTTKAELINQLHNFYHNK